MSCRTCVQLDDSVVSSGFFDSFDYVLTDCDGVLWMGNVAIPGSVDTIKTLKNMGKHIIYVTNNSTKSREEYLKKCETLGFPAKIDDIISTSYCAAAYLLSKNFKKKVYILGSVGVSGELDKANIPYLPIGADPVPENWIQWLSEVQLDPEVGAVVVGFDHHISYPKLTKAASYLKDPDTIFIATNKDEQFPTEYNLTIPGAGTFVHAVEVVTGRKATTLGKPERFMLDCIKQTHPNIDFSRCIMIGDRLNTDIMLGTKHGLKTLLVLTGINSLEDVRQFEKGVLWNNDEPIPGSIEAIKCLKEMGKHILYVTNNSSKTRDYFFKKCQRLGFPATFDDIISTAYCTAMYLKAQNFQKKVYIIGGSGIGEELDEVNISHLPIGPDNVPDNWVEWIKELKLDPEVGAVVVGFDPYMSYPKLTKAASYLRNPETLFLATNRDEKVIMNNKVVPCTGVLVSAVEIASGRKATTIGKPEKQMLDGLKLIHPDVDFSRCIMIGDRLDTDILFGTRHGIKTLLVLTGNDSLEGVRNLQGSAIESDLALVPDYYLPCLGDLKIFIS